MQNYSKNVEIDEKLFLTQPISSNFARLSVKQFFRYTKDASRYAQCSIKEAEHLKLRPVSGVISWYEVSYKPKTKIAWASKVFLQAPKSGQISVLNIPENYPQQAPSVDGVLIDLEPNLTLRDYVKQVISRIETHQTPNLFLAQIFLNKCIFGNCAVTQTLELHTCSLQEFHKMCDSNFACLQLKITILQPKFSNVKIAHNIRSILRNPHLIFSVTSSIF